MAETERPDNQATASKNGRAKKSAKRKRTSGKKKTTKKTRASAPPTASDELAAAALDEPEPPTASEQEDPDPEPAESHIERDGQRLVKLTHEPAPKSIDDVARKYLTTDDADSGEQQDEPETEEYMSVEEIAGNMNRTYGTGAVPPVDDRPEQRDGLTMGHVSFTSDAEIPDFADPDSKPRTLEDLLAIFPIGSDPRYYIRVERKAPKSWGGHRCQGLQRPIRDSISSDEFKMIYGGGDYALIAYGPPARGGQLDPRTNRIRPKALTGEVRLSVPVGEHFGLPPNPDATFTEDELRELQDESPYYYDDSYEEEEPMVHRSIRGMTTPPRRVTTPADAKVQEAMYEHERAAWSREDQKEREFEQRLREKEERERAQQQTLTSHVSETTKDILKIMDDHNREQVSAMAREREQAELRRAQAEEHARELQEAHRREMDEQYQREREELQRKREEIENKPSPAKDLAEALKVLQQGGSANASELKALRDQVDTLRDAHQRELDRMVKVHASELERERQAQRDQNERAEKRIQDADDRADRRIQDAEGRTEKRVREVEENADRRIRDMQERAERDLKLAKDERDRAVADIERIWKDRLESEQRNHDREVRALEATYSTRLDTQKSISESQTSIAQNEIARERAERERYQQEAEQKSDVVAQVQRVTAIAEQLGYSREAGGEQPQDWKSLLVGMGAQVAQNLPEILNNAGNAVAKARGNTPQVQVVQNPYSGYSAPALPAGPMQTTPGQGAPAQAVPMAFGTEDGPEFEGSPHVAPPPMGQVFPPPQRPAAPPQPSQPQPGPGPAPLSAQMAPAERPAPAPAAAGPPAPAPTPTGPPETAIARRRQAQQPQQSPERRASTTPISTEAILAYRQAFEEAYVNKIAPKDFAQSLFEKYGQAVVSSIASTITPQDINKALQTVPDGARSPLVRRDGQQYLKALFAAIRETAGG